MSWIILFFFSQMDMKNIEQWISYPWTESDWEIRRKEYVFTTFYEFWRNILQFNIKNIQNIILKVNIWNVFRLDTHYQPLVTKSVHCQHWSKFQSVREGLSILLERKSIDKHRESELALNCIKVCLSWIKTKEYCKHWKRKNHKLWNKIL